MRILIASWVAFFGCKEDPLVEVMLDLPSSAPAIDGRSVRVSIGEVDNFGFHTIAGTGGSASAESFLVSVPAGEGLRARALIYEGDFVAVLHGQSDPFNVVDAEDPTMVRVPLRLPPEGFVTGAIASGATALISMQARRWSSVRIGVLPKQPTHEGLRPSTSPENDILEPISLEYPLDMVQCAIETGCPTTLFVDFFANDGVAGQTKTATVTVDLVPPSLSTRSRIEGADALGAGSRLEVSIEGAEPITDVLLTLTRTVERQGPCPPRLGPYGCMGTGRRFTCTVEAPTAPCEAEYSVAVTATDLVGNLSSVGGASIAVDSIAPQVAVTSVVCGGGVLVASGTASGATQVVLEDADGAMLASAMGSSFRLASSSSVAVSVAAIDGGGNETKRDVMCP